LPQGKGHFGVIIAIDASSIAKPHRSGVAVSLMNLVDALAKIDRENEYLLCYRLSRLRNRRYFHCPPAENFRIKVFHDPFLFPRAADIFHGNARLPSCVKIPATVRVHDTFSLLRNDLADPGFREKKCRRYRHIARRATRIIVSSRSVARDVVRTLGVPESRIVVNPHGVSSTFFRRSADEIRRVTQKHRIPLPYCLMVAAFSKRKNVHRVLHAYAALKRENKLESALVLAGSLKHWAEGRQVVERLNLSDKVVLTGYVPDEDLPALYSGARMLIYPSLIEGFGLPLLESMACGTPVITSNVSSMPEIAGDAALLVDPEDVDDIKERMAQLDADQGLRRRLSRKGLQRVKPFTWERAARTLLDVWKEIVENGVSVETNLSWEVS